MGTSKVHSSFFTYNLSKPYPFTWFTPVVVVGGVIATVIFSIVNLATNGYTLGTISTNNPQAVINQTSWYSSWSWTKQFNPKCEPQDISLGAQVFTSNLGFTYTLKSVSRSTSDQNGTDNLGSLSYLGELLDDCRVTEIRFDLRKADDSTSQLSFWWSWDDSSGYGEVQCTVLDSNRQKVNVTFETQYKTGSADYTYVIQSDPSTKASMWWATRLLNAYWYSTFLALSEQRFGQPGTDLTDRIGWSRGSMSFKPNPDVSDIKRYDFFQNPSFRFISINGFIWNDGNAGVVNEKNLSVIYNNVDYLPFSATFTQGISWSKIMYSALLVDLGQTASSLASSQNVLTNSDLLQYILQHPDDTFRNNASTYFNATRNCGDGIPMPCYPWYKDINMFAPPTVMSSILPDWSPLKNTSMTDSYKAFRDLMGPLGTKNATISRTYACQVPKPKSPLTVILSVLVADLVFLQACWTLLNVIATGLLNDKNRYPYAMQCLNCGGSGENFDNINNVAINSEGMEKVIHWR